MFVNNIDPVLFSIGPFEIRYYGLAYAIGFLIGYWFLFNIGKKRLIKNFDEKKADSLIFYSIIGMLIGARIVFFLFANPSVFFQDPLELFRVWNGGMSFHGALVGMIISTSIFAKKHNVSFLRLADAISLISTIGLTLGRLANFTNSELYGPVTNVFWCVKFRTAEGCRHPYQIYAALSHFVTFIILYLLYKKPHKPGFIFYNFIAIYGLFRFVTDFFRDDAPFLLGLSLGQVASLLMMILGVYFLIRCKTYK